MTYSPYFYSIKRIIDTHVHQNSLFACNKVDKVLNKICFQNIVYKLLIHSNRTGLKKDVYIKKIG